MKDETKAEKRISSVETGEDNEDGSKPSAASIVEQADAAAERLEKANAERLALLEREEQILAKRKLGGETSGPTTAGKKELSPVEYKDQYLLTGKIPEE